MTSPLTGRGHSPRALLLASAVAILPFSSYADQLSTDEVVVSASRGAKLSDMDVSTSVITQQQVLQAPEETIDQILNKVPGVVVPMVPSNQIHPTGKYIQMRGFGGTGERVLVMVDGIPVNDPYFRYVNWDKIPKDTIDRIEVIRGGGATSLWGNLAMGGVINIVTKQPDHDAFYGSAGYGNYNTFRTTAGGSFVISPLVTVAANLSRAQTDGYNLTPSAFQNNHTTPTQSYSDNAELAAYLTPASGSRYYVKASIHDIKEFGLVQDIAKNTQDSYEFKAGGATIMPDDSRLDINGWFGRYEMKTENASWSPSYNYTNPGKNLADYLSTLDHNPYYDYGGSAVWKKDMAGEIAQIMVGADTRNIFGKDDSQAYGSGGSMTAETVTHGQQQSNGIFTQILYRPDALPLDVTLGLREDFWRAFGAETNAVGQHAYGNYAHFDPRLGLKYLLSDSLSARAAVYEDYAAPGMNQLFRSYGNSAAYSEANGALTPETNLGFEGGLDYKWRDITLSGTLFHNSLSRFIDRATLCTTTASCTAYNPPGITASKISKAYNGGDAITEGWELEAAWVVRRDLTANFSIARTIAYMSSNSVLARQFGQKTADSLEPLHSQLGQVPPIMVMVGSSWEPTDKLRLTAQVRAWTKTPDDTQHTVTNSSAAVIDLGVTYAVTEHVQLFASGDNIFNRYYYATGLNNSSTASPPTLGAPAMVFGGVRVAY